MRATLVATAVAVLSVGRGVTEADINDAGDDAELRGLPQGPAPLRVARVRRPLRLHAVRL